MPVKPQLLDVRPPRCSHNWHDHQWTLSIEEGRVSVVAQSCGPDCGPATDGLAEWSDGIEMAPVVVVVRSATDCPAYDTDDNGVPIGPAKRMSAYEAGSHYVHHGVRCDCNWWPVLTIGENR